MKNNVYLKSSSVCCALGDANSAVKLLRENKTNISAIEIQYFNEKLNFPYYKIEGFKNSEKNTILEILYKITDEVITQEGFTKDEISDCSVFVGSSSADMSFVEIIENRFSGELPEIAGNGYYTHKISHKFGLSNLCFTFNTACTSSANALISAANMIQNGTIKNAIVIGLEKFNQTTIEGFVSMQLLSKNNISPFDKNRDGIVLGEAISVIILSSNPSSWQYLGGSSGCDTFGIAASNTDGIETSKVMMKALEKANKKTSDIKAIKAHATASLSNDLTEANAMKIVFKKEKLPPFFSLKPYIGHTLGGCAIVELVLFKGCIDEGFLPKSINFDCIDDELGISPETKNMAVKKGIFMLNYFGFGGNNASLIIQKEEL